MRILQVASSLNDWGGIERYVHYLSEGLTERGHEVVVACPPGSPLDRHLRVHKRHIRLRSKRSPLSALPYLRLFSQARFDIVHAHFSPDFIWPAWAARRYDQKTIMTRHVSLPWPAGKVKTYRQLYDHIIPVSDSVRRRLLESGVPDALMTVAKAGVPALLPGSPRQETRRQLGIAHDAIAIGCFGRLVPEKGTHVLLEAMKHVRHPAELHIFGEGPEQSRLERLLTPQATMHGFIENVSDAMEAMDLVVIPSVWEEAFPYSALETMSLGRPIVGSNIGGIPEIVLHGITGLLTEPNDPKSLASAMDAMAADSDMRSRMGAAGAERQRAEFTVQLMAERIDAVYRKLTGPNESS